MGTLTRLWNFVTDKNNKVVITASKVDGELNQILTESNSQDGRIATLEAAGPSGGTKILLTEQISSPANPAAGDRILFFKTDNRLYVLDESGVEFNITHAVVGKTTAPSTTDDSNSGFLPGYVWIDETGDTAYVCLDSTVSAAVWKRVSFSEVDVASTDTTKDKVVSNLLAKGWQDFKNLLTTRGDIIYRDATTNARLPIAARGAILTSGVSDPQWLVKGAAGALLHSDGTDPEWLAKGVNNQILHPGSASLGWTNLLAPTAGSASMVIVHADQRKMFLLNSGDDTTPTLPAITSAMDGMVVGFHALDATGFTITTDGTNKFNVNVATTLKLTYASEFVILMARYDATASAARWDVISENRLVGFEARDGSTTSIAASTDTKSTCDTEAFDPQGDYDNTTNFRYTISEAGPYHVYFKSVPAVTMATNTLLRTKIYINGVVTDIDFWGHAVQAGFGSGMTSLAFFTKNFAKGDYIEFFIWQDDSVSRICDGLFGAFKIK